ncbi:MAG: DUF5668 domain-containing protein [candidate division KSB1 bacterium]|nr:DUF5668 domain-containing protein [candidate division KSB1 bacterium]MDZ7301861.1 DUF5668 domain-containing protein [candidate division KSB1 bacterium]MDZ7310244.1 DUF5668 domain-containing protein [candidate division KSB1 bacterium]
MSDRRGSLVGGLILIMIGLALLANRLHVRLPSWEYIYPFAFVLLGLASAYRIRGRGHCDGVFGTVFFLSLGAFFLLRNFDFIPYFHSWPVFPLAVGLGLLAEFVFVPSRWGVLIPGFALLLFGLALLFEELEYWYFYDVLRFWPVILIAFGIGILLNAMRRRA